MMDLGNYINKLAYRGKTEHQFNCHIQDILSNGADILHFKFIHNYIVPRIKSLYLRWEPKWKKGNDPTLIELI